MKNVLPSLLVVILMTSGISFAADQTPVGNPMGACKPDVEKLCSDVQRGGGRVLACLKQNADQLSDACKDSLLKMRRKTHSAAGQTPAEPSPPSQ